MQASLGRFNSGSTGKTTLVGSDDTHTAWHVSAPSHPRSLSVPGAIIQTEDSKQWIDLDLISPKLLKEIRRRYEPPASPDAKSSLSKGAAIIKAWTRQTKHGFDIRLRRKLSSQQDEVTDFSLVREPWPTQGQPFEPVELPTSFVFEMPENPDPVELPVSTSQYDLPSSRTPERPRSVATLEDDPLPVYEPRKFATAATEQQSIVLREHDADASSVQHSPSSSPTRGFSVATTAVDLHRAEANDKHEAGQPEIATEIAREDLEARLQEAKISLEREKSLRAKLELSLTALKDEATSRDDQQEPDHNPFRDLQIQRAIRYETETDAEPISPTRVRRVTNKERKRAPKRSKPTLTGSRSLELETTIADDVPAAVDKLVRKSTRPKKVLACEGPEAIWLSLLQAQELLLGSEHPLVFEARHKLALSRVQHHENCPASLVTPLRQSRDLGQAMLGPQHPRVQAFTDDLSTLESVILSSTGLGTLEKEDLPRAIERPVSPVKRTAANPWDDESPRIDTSAVSPAQQPISPLIGNNQSPTRSPLLTELPKLIVSDASGECAIHESSRDPLSNASVANFHPPRSLTVFGGLIIQATTSTIINSLQWLQRNYGPEPAVQSDKVRVRWTCSCGQHLYDDYEENKPGAARALEVYLNRPRSHTKSHSPHMHTHSPVSPSSNHSGNGSYNPFSQGPSAQSSWSSFHKSHPSSPQSLDSKNPFRTAPTLPSYTPYVPPSETRWLLVCANEDRLTPKVAHLDMSPHLITSDKRFALALREHYFRLQRQRKWTNVLRCRALTTIEFVRFEAHRNRFADVRKSPDMPPLGTEEYAFVPGDLMPPVGPQYLLHLFRHPDDYDDELVTYLRAPKRNARLEGGLGWGFHMVEGFDAGRVWAMVNVLFGVVSLVFAVAWVCERHDIQGAFGVAQWVSAIAVLVAGWVQAYIA